MSQFAGGEDLGWKSFPQADEFETRLHFPPIPSAHPSSSSTALVPISSARAPTFRSNQRSDLSVSLTSKLPKKLRLEPVLAKTEDRWLTRPGAPPRQHPFSAVGSFVSASMSPLAAVEAADREVAERTARIPETPPLCQIRQPPVPRMTAKRIRPLAGFKTIKSSASSTTAKHLLELKQTKSAEIMEARYTRDLAGKNTSFWRSSLDQDMSHHDFEVAAFADYRQAASFYYGKLDRNKAAGWREVASRKNAISEVQWLLQQALVDTSKRNADEDVGHLRQSGQNDEESPCAPRPSPCPSKGRSSARFSMRGPRRSRQVVVMFNEAMDGGAGTVTEGFEGTDSDDGGSADNDRGIVSKLQRNSVKQHMMPWRQRMQRLKREGRKWMMAKRSSAEADNGNSPSDAPDSRMPSSRSISFCEKGRQSTSSSEDDDSDSHQELAEAPTVHRSTAQARPSQVAAFNQWSIQDQEALHRTFDRFDSDHSGSLDQSEISSCLADLGLRGKNQRERDEIRQIVWDTDMLEIGFYEFATKVVPRIRDRLRELQDEKLHAAFEEADIDGSGMLSVAETLRQLRLMGTFPSEAQVKTAITQVCPDAADNAQTLDGNWLMDRDLLNFKSFSALVHLLQELTDRATTDRFKQVIVDNGLNEEQRKTWNHNLVDVYQVFCRFATEGISPPVVSKQNAISVVRECGLGPRGAARRHLTGTVMAKESDQDSNLNFSKFLHSCERLRDEDRQWLHRVFYNHDKDHTGGLSLEEVQSALMECGVRPRTAHETEEMRVLIDEFDEDCSGEVDQEEFQQLFRFVSEKLHKVQREVEYQTAVRYGWNDNHFKELRSAFLALDQDASDTLEVHEMMQVIEGVQVGVGRDDVKGVMEEAGLGTSSKDQTVDFLSFMKIVKSLENADAQRAVARTYGFEGEAISRLRLVFKELAPNEDYKVSRERLRILLTSSNQDTSPAIQKLANELNTTHPPMVDFEVFVIFMKKKMDVAVRRRTSFVVSD